MAVNEHENDIGFIDKRYDNRSSTGLSGTAHSTVNYNDVGSMRTRLAAVNGAYFTTTRLDQMTKNDMVMALRLADDTAGV